MTRVLLVDDDSLVRTGLRLILQAGGIDVVGEAADGHAAIAAVDALLPDVVFMDVRMPGLDGISATRMLIERHPSVRVVILTTFALDEYVFAAIRAGASGFLLKRASPEELVAAVATVASGDALLSPEVTRRLLDAVAARHPVQATVGLERLTEREVEVLRLIAAGLSNAEIADDLVIAESTAKTHVKRILAKLSLRDRAQAVVAAYESGLVRPAGGTTSRR